MKKTRIMLWESEHAKRLYPATLTRAAFDVNIGGFTLYSLIKEYFNAEVCYNVRKEILNATISKHGPSGKDFDMVVDANAVPSLENMKKIERMLKTKKDEKLDMVEYPHQIIVWHRKICKENIEYMADRKKYSRPEDGICIGKDVRVHESAVIDSENGPVIIDDGSIVMPFSYIAGPVYIGKNTKIVDHASIKNNVVILDTCKVGGEVEDSIIMSYSNKQHYGFLGNSFVGEWVNMGAGTTTSDLKNTYGTISVIDGEGKAVESGEQFLGSVIGDYVKTAINTSLFTGKTIGVNSMLYGTVDRDVPSFINYVQHLKGKNEEFSVVKAIEIQKKMFERRKIEQRKEDILLLEGVFECTVAPRIRFLN